MNPDTNIHENDPEKDREKCPWMYERVFGGKLISGPHSGFFYDYDVFMCIPADALVDCLGDIIPRLSSKWGYGSYFHMRREFYDGHGNNFIFLLHQLSARFIGAVIFGEIVGGLLRLINGI